MIGLLDSGMARVESTVQLGRLKDKPASPHEAFVAVAERISELFASLKRMTQFDPDPSDIDEAPSQAFARARVAQAQQKYEAALKDLYSVWTNLDDLDSPLLNTTNSCFGVVKGLPCFSITL